MADNHKELCKRIRRHFKKHIDLISLTSDEDILVLLDKVILEVLLNEDISEDNDYSKTPIPEIKPPF